MNLGKQIDSLLKRQPSVYVKGLGVFKRVHTPATFDSKRRVFLPPISFIEFDHFEEEGYDFISYLQQVGQIDREEATANLNTVIVALMDKINQHSEVVLDSLGTLVAYGNSYVFKPLDLSGFLYIAVEDDFHASSGPQANTDEDSTIQEAALRTEEVTPPSSASVDTQQPNVPAEPVQEKQEEIIAPAPVEPAHEEQEETIAPVEPAHEKQTIAPVAVSTEEEVSAAAVPEAPLQEYKESNSYVYGLVAAAAILILGGIYYYMTVYKAKEPVATLERIEIPITNPTYSDTTAEITAVNPDTISNLVAQDTVVVNTAVEPPKKAPIVDHKYIIVIGTHATLEQAYKQAESFNKQGHRSVRVLLPNMEKNKKRVIWDTYPTREKRDSALREVRKHNKPDAWGAEI